MEYIRIIQDIYTAKTQRQREKAEVWKWKLYMEGKSDEENMKQKILGRKKMINTTKNKNCRENRKSCGRFEKKRGLEDQSCLLAIQEITSNRKEQRPNYWTCYYFNFNFNFILYGLLFFCCCCSKRDMREREGDLTDPNKATTSVTAQSVHILFI